MPLAPPPPQGRWWRLLATVCLACTLFAAGTRAAEFVSTSNIKLVAKPQALLLNGAAGDGSTPLQDTTANLANATPSQTVVLYEGASLSSLLDVVATVNLGSTTAIQATVTCGAQQGTTMTLALASGGAPTANTSALTVGGTVATPTTLNGALVTVTCTFSFTNFGNTSMTVSTNVSANSADTLSFRAYIVPSKTNAVFQVAAGGLLTNNAGNALLAAGTALDSVSHTGRAVAVSAAQDVVGWLEIINVAGPTAVDYQVR